MRAGGDFMNNATAIILSVLILGAVAADSQMNESQNLIFLGRELLKIIDWLAFWR
jgi:hypothetical protein